MLRALLAILLLATVPALPAAAQGKAKGNPGMGKGPPAARGAGGSDHDEWHRFSDSDRRWWQDYWHEESARGHCPPGLAKKRNGCLPPGQAKKRYTVGRPLPVGVVLVEVPAPLLGRLPRLEPGYRYGMVDGDLLKLTVGTMLVVDAIDGMLR